MNRIALFAWFLHERLAGIDRQVQPETLVKWFNEFANNADSLDELEKAVATSLGYGDTLPPLAVPDDLK